MSSQPHLSWIVTNYNGVFGLQGGLFLQKFSCFDEILDQATMYAFLAGREASNPGVVHDNDMINVNIILDGNKGAERQCWKGGFEGNNYRR